MAKQKVRIHIIPIQDVQKPPIRLDELAEFLDYIVSRFTIDSIKIQLREHKRPSEIYFEFLSGLCKANTKNVQVYDYISNKKHGNIFMVDSFECMNLLIDNTGACVAIFNNKKTECKTMTELMDYLSKL